MTEIKKEDLKEAIKEVISETNQEKKKQKEITKNITKEEKEKLYNLKKAWLDNLYYKIGKQETDFRLCHTFLDDSNEIQFTKWKHYLEIIEDKFLIIKANQRECLKNEIILDLDGNGDYLQLIERLKQDNVYFYAYSTKGGRARHIHTYWEGISHLCKDDRKKIREEFIAKYNCDLQLSIDSHMIPLEYTLHWKTGQLKELIDKNEGINVYIPKENQIVSLRRLQETLIDTFSIKRNIEQFSQRCPFFYDKSENFWFWSDTLSKWEMCDDVDVMNSLDAAFNFGSCTLKSSVKNEYLEAMKRLGRKLTPKQLPNTWIQFKDRLFNIESKQIIPATPEYFICNPIPHELGESADTPIIDKLFTEWVGNEWKDTLYEILAYSCITDYPIHIMIGLNGTGRNGKSKFLKLLERFIGIDNCCSTELDDLVGNRFESAKLYKKLVCTMGETNFEILKNTSRLKKLTGQDLVGFEYKNKTPFNDINYAKIIISSNNFPDTDDTSDGFYRRWLIIDFPNEFKEGKDILKDIPEYEYNNLCNKVCVILPTLLEKGLFSNQGTIEERRKRYIMASNPFPDFLEKCCIKDAGVYIRQSELKQAYTFYLIANKRRVVNWKGFKDAIEREGITIDKTNKKIGDQFISDRYIIGYTLKTNWKEFVTIVTNVTNISISKNSYIEEIETQSQSSQLSQFNVDIKNIESPEEIVKRKILTTKDKGWYYTDDFYNTVQDMIQKGLIFESPSGCVRLI